MSIFIRTLKLSSTCFLENKTQQKTSPSAFPTEGEVFYDSILQNIQFFLKNLRKSNQEENAIPMLKILIGWHYTAKNTFHFNDQLNVTVRKEEVIININLTYDWANFEYYFTADRPVPCKVDWKYQLADWGSLQYGVLNAGATTINYKMPSVHPQVNNVWLWKLNNVEVSGSDHTFEKDNKIYRFVFSIEGGNVEDDPGL